MNTLPIAIAWEIWRKNRWAFIIMGFALAICSIANFTAIRFSEDLSVIRPTLLSLGASFMGLSILILLGVFGYSEPDKETGFAFPERFFVMPISTIRLITLFAVYGLIAGSLLYLAWAYIVFSPLQITLPVRYHLVCLAAGNLTFQAIVWGLAPVPKIRALAATGLIFGLLYVFISPLDAVWTVAYEKRMLVRLIALSLFAYVTAWLAVSAERHGVWSGRQRFPGPKSRSILFRSILNARLSSPSQALAWMEWRRNGMVPSLIIISILLLGCFAIVVGTENIVVRHVSTLSIGILLPLTLALSSLFFARDCVSNQLKLSPYLAAHPCSIEALLIAKLKNMAAVGLITIAGGLICLLLIFALPIVRAGEIPKSLEYTGLASTVMLLLRVAPVFLLSLLVGGLPIWLTGRITSMPIAAAFWLFFLVSLGFLRGFVLNHIPVAVPVLIALWALLKFGVAYLAFRRAYQNHLLSAKTVLLLVGIWIVFTSVSLSAVFRLPDDFIWKRETLVLIVPLLCPLARLALSPLALDFNRHR